AQGLALQKLRALPGIDKVDLLQAAWQAGTTDSAQRDFMFALGLTSSADLEQWLKENLALYYASVLFPRMDMQTELSPEGAYSRGFQETAEVLRRQRVFVESMPFLLDIIDRSLTE